MSEQHPIHFTHDFICHLTTSFCATCLTVLNDEKRGAYLPYNGHPALSQSSWCCVVRVVGVKCWCPLIGFLQ